MNFTQMMSHCKTLRASSYRGSRESFKQEYLALTKGGKILLPKMENMLKKKNGQHKDRSNKLKT